MSKTKNKENNKSYEQILLLVYYVLFFVLMMIIHQKMFFYSDDVVFFERMESMSLPELLKQLYYSLSGKVITDGLGGFLTTIPFDLWKAIDSIFWLVCLYMANRVIKVNRVSEYFMSLFVMIIFPVYFLTSAGFILTSTNYVYPSFTLLACIFIIKTQISGQSTGKKALMYFLLTIFAIYTSGQEQSAAVLIGILVTELVAEFFMEKTEDKDYIVSLIFTLIVVSAGLVFLLTAPAHIARSKGMTGTFAVPGYPDWTFLYKIYRGFTSTVANIVYYPVHVYLIFTVIIAFVGLSNKKAWINAISMIPCLFCIYNYYLDFGRFAYFPDYGFGMMELKEYGSVFLTGLINIVLPLMVFGIICIVISESFENNVDSFKMVILLCIGFGIRVIMGFSATLFGSSFRTCVYTLFIMMFETCILFKKIKIEKLKMWAVIITIIVGVYMLYINSNVGRLYGFY